MNANRKKHSKIPKISVASLVQRGSDLAAICRRDRTYLQRSGLPWEHVVAMHKAALELAESDAVWRVENDRRLLLTHKMKKLVATAFMLQKMVVRRMRVANALSGLNLKIPSFSERRSQADIIQNLNDLSVLGYYYIKNFKKWEIEPPLLRQAAVESKLLAERLAAH